MQYSQKEATGEAIIALLIVGALVGGIVFFEKKTETLSHNLKDMRAAVASRSGSIQNRADLQMQYDRDGSRYLNVLYNVVPEKDELIDLSKEMRVIAGVGSTEYGFSFLDERRPTEIEVGAVQFGINLRSNSVKEILDSIQRLQSFRFVTRLEQFTITEDKEGALNLSTKGEVIYR